MFAKGGMPVDQAKTGRFIAQRRKAKQLTQRQLADLLDISDKTVSKWERGNGLPEVSLMLPLCKILEISVNELLSGESIQETELRQKTEEVIMDLVKEREENRKRVLLSVVCALTTILAVLTIVLSAGLLSMQTWARILLLVIGLFVILGGLSVCAALEWNAGTYECRHCGARFVPSQREYIAGPHTLTRRYLRCPECGQKSLCRRRLSH